MTRLPERPLLLLLAAVQFTHIMDFMVMMPLGPQLMRDLDIGPGRFSALVAAYTLAAGAMGLLTAPFMDRFDRRTLLLFAYAGFGAGTLACALAHTASSLLVARAVCGAFGGVSGSVVLAIVGDVVPPERRASGMGIIMTAFSTAAALGVPFGLYLAHRFTWETPFFLLAGLAAAMLGLLFLRLPPVRGHLNHAPGSRRPFVELMRDANAGRALLFMAALVLGHFAIIPFLSPYLVANVHLAEKNLSLVYLVGGVATVFALPRIGRLADRVGRLRVYTVLVGVACGVTLILTNTGPLPLWAVLALAGVFFVFASGRFVPGQAIMSLAVPATRRGAFMSLTSCTRDLTSGLASTLGGWIVTATPTGELRHFNWLGWLAVGASLLSLWLARHVRVNDLGPTGTGPVGPEAASPSPEAVAIAEM